MFFIESILIPGIKQGMTLNVALRHFELGFSQDKILFPPLIYQYKCPENK